MQCENHASHLRTMGRQTQWPIGNVAFFKNTAQQRKAHAREDELSANTQGIEQNVWISPPIATDANVAPENNNKQTEAGQSTQQATSRMADVELSLDEKQAEFLGEPPPAYPSVVGDAYLYQPQAEAYPVGVGVPAYGPYVAPTQVQTGMYFPTPQNSAAEEEQPIRGSGSRGRYSQNAQTQMAFNDKSVRMAFVRKVYGILLVQLFLTAAVVCVFMFVNPVRRYCQWHMWPVLTAM